MPLEVNCVCEDDDGTSPENLGQLRTRLMYRLGYGAQAANPPPGMAALLNDFLVSAQRVLYQKHPQTRAVRFFTWTMTPDERFYDVAANDEACTKVIDPRKIHWAGVEDLNGTWYEMTNGVPPEFYTLGTEASLPYRYEIRQCIEVFPAPDEAYKIRIKANVLLNTPTADADVFAVDSECVFLWALGNAKAHYQQPDAAIVKKEAQDYLGTLVAGDHGTKRYIPKGEVAPPLPRPVMAGGFED